MVGGNGIELLPLLRLAAVMKWQRVLMNTREEVIEQLQQEYDDRCAWCDQYETLVAPLFELSQLFIAA
jgi:hypothetical protein